MRIAITLVCVRRCFWSWRPGEKRALMSAFLTPDSRYFVYSYSAFFNRVPFSGAPFNRISSNNTANYGIYPNRLTALHVISILVVGYTAAAFCLSLGDKLCLSQ